MNLYNYKFPDYHHIILSHVVHNSCHILRNGSDFTIDIARVMLCASVEN